MARHTKRSVLLALKVVCLLPPWVTHLESLKSSSPQQVYFSTDFFLRNSFKDHHFYDVGAACLFLATKTEECGRHLDDIVRDVMKHCSKTENFKVEKDSKEFKTWKRIIIFMKN
ncbi:hypothetical protein DSO57_1012599 [Entomophthora muscae]|uniref:Uncharacterized protein n=1 Tax=Entomophthora muscae TaxID=34485 RepID=A0ACC2URX1_9FUNG|nr:hypothetical protein DSO57_1012599 [Entomophthora muscae]